MNPWGYVAIASWTIFILFLLLRWQLAKRAPVYTVQAVLLDKAQDDRKMKYNRTETMNVTYYHLAFVLEESPNGKPLNDRTRLKLFEVDPIAYERVEPGDRGMLTFKGDRLLRFKHFREEQEGQEEQQEQEHTEKADGSAR